MPRLLAALLCSVVLFASACGRGAQEAPEPAGPLEGTWRVGLTDPVEYDAQNKVLLAYTPAAGILEFTRLRFAATTLEQFDPGLNNWSPATPCARTGDELACPLPARSYTIRKLTARHLDLYYRGDYLTTGPRHTRTDLTIHLDRE